MQTMADAAQAWLADQQRIFDRVEIVRPCVPEWDWRWLTLPGDTPAERRKLAEMVGGARDFVSDVAAGRSPRWLTLAGRAGCGKTHLADRIRWWLRAHGRRCYEAHARPAPESPGHDYTCEFSYAQEGSVLSKWSRLLDAAREGDYHPLRRAARDHYKVLDDLGADSFDREAQATVFAAQKMAELLDRRLGQWTVITTNYSLRQLAQLFDTRIASRLLRGSNIFIDCGDLRDFSLRSKASATLTR